MGDPDLGVCELGEPGPLRDRLVAAVLRGAKTATRSLLSETRDAARRCRGREQAPLWVRVVREVAQV